MMKKILFICAIFVFFSFTYVVAASTDSNFSSKLKGKLLLATEDKGRIWYMNPTDSKRYEVTFANALSLFKKLSLGISTKDLNQISQTKSTTLGNKLKGKLLLATEDKGRIWYIDTNGLKHEVTWANLMDLFRKLSLGITNTDLNKIISEEIQVTVDTNIDSDKDGLTDLEEIKYKTNPNNPDTDGDGYLDGDEVKNGYDPLKGGNAKLENPEIIFADKLTSCTKYKTTFIHPITGKTLEKEILGIINEKCNYIEQMPNNGKMECKYTETERTAIAQYYKDIASAESIGVTVNGNLPSDEHEIKYLINGKEVENPLQEATDIGVCIVSGY